MTCPKCGMDESKVTDSRPGADLGGGLATRRRRRCDNCGHKWTTFEIDGSHYEAIQSVTRTLAAIRAQLDGLAATIDGLPNLDRPDTMLDALRRKTTRKGAA